MRGLQSTSTTFWGSAYAKGGMMDSFVGF